ncbi:MAG: DoxX family protein [Candidatus Pacebacteria bacterium]|nr:DoxX family protein [Candidatus Paceibacterota bacterium]
MNSEKPFALLRIAFGVVWAIDAGFKWTPSFINGFTGYLTSALDGQPAWIQDWINMWVHFVSINPHAFAIVVALGESAIAAGLIFGLFTRLALAGGIILALVIWVTAEGFGGPYAAGSTDVGTGIIYVLVFIALWLGRSWRSYSLDSLIKRRLRSSSKNSE